MAIAKRQCVIVIKPNRFSKIFSKVLDLVLADYIL